MSTRFGNRFDPFPPDHQQTAPFEIMIPYDQHLHTWFSMDSKTDPDENCQAALERGLHGLTFTDHVDWYEDVGWNTDQFNYPAQADTVARLREVYEDRLWIGHGIEVGYQPGRMEEIIGFLSRHRFDLVILSVHRMSGLMLSEHDQWRDLDSPTATRMYFDECLDAVRMCVSLRQQGQPWFDVLGHLDLVKRYTKRFRGEFDVRSHADVIREILGACLEAGLVPEINTSTWRQNMSEPMPAAWIVQQYAELGGTTMTVGSDAHKAADIGAGFDQAESLLLDSGIRHLAVLRDRQAAQVAIAEAA